MKPTLEEYQSGSTSWVSEHRGVRYKLNHHGLKTKEYMDKYGYDWDETNEGIWCYYIYLYEPMFVNQEDFAKFNKEPQTYQMSTGSYHETHDYYAMPDLDFHGGVTWYKRHKVLDSVSGEYVWNLEIGCDYNHAFDRECGYYHTKNDVEMCCKRTIDILVTDFPMKIRCKFSGKIDIPENFYYTEKNSRAIHFDSISKLSKRWMDGGYYNPNSDTDQKFINEWDRCYLIAKDD